MLLRGISQVDQEDYQEEIPPQRGALEGRVCHSRHGMGQAESIVHAVRPGHCKCRTATTRILDEHKEPTGELTSSTTCHQPSVANIFFDSTISLRLISGREVHNKRAKLRYSSAPSGPDQDTPYPERFTSVSGCASN